MGITQDKTDQVEQHVENAGHKIIQSIKIGNAEYVIGENLDAPQPYVVWEKTGEQYQMGHYCESYEQTLHELLSRAQHEARYLEDFFKQRGIANKALTGRDCIPNSKNEDFTNRLVMLDPQILKPMYRKSEYQVLLATTGFGCDPDASGRRVYTKALFDGHEESFYRQDFLGILDPERYPAWVSEKLRAQEEEAEYEDEQEAY